jgi:hypothetical protein
MNWIPITEADLLATTMAPLMDVLRSAALGPGQDDPVEVLTASVVTRIRAKVATCSSNFVATNTALIPASLKDLACRLIACAAKGRLGYALTDDERNQMTIDERDLTLISQCKLVVEQPEDAVAAPVQATQAGPTIKGRRPQFKRWQQSGA